MLASLIGFVTFVNGIFRPASGIVIESAECMCIKAIKTSVRNIILFEVHGSHRQGLLIFKDFSRTFQGLYTSFSRTLLRFLLLYQLICIHNHGHSWNVALKYKLKYMYLTVRTATTMQRSHVAGFNDEYDLPYYSNTMLQKSNFPTRRF